MSNENRKPRTDFPRDSWRPKHRTAGVALLAAGFLYAALLSSARNPEVLAQPALGAIELDRGASAQLQTDGFETGTLVRWRTVGGVPRLDLRYPYTQSTADPALVGANFRVSFWVENWPLGPDSRHIHLFIDGEDRGPHFSHDPIAVTGLADGPHTVMLRLARADHSYIDDRFPMAAAEVQVLVNETELSTLVIPGAIDGQSLRPGGDDLGYLPRPSEQDVSDAGGRIPPCESHDRHNYHALYDPSRNCHYDHEHKDDPTRVTGVFGKPWEWLPQRHQDQLPPGQTIAYPWQTWAGLDAGAPRDPNKLENVRKHEGFGWMVRSPEDYPGFECFSANSSWCITHHRYQYHAVAGLPGALTRRHSFFLEARFCDQQNTADCGLLRTGGILDFAELRSDTEHVPLPSDPDNIDRSGRRLHGGMAADSVRRFARDFTWYPEHRLASIAVRGTSWTTLDPDALLQPRFYCEDPTRCRFPNSDMSESHLTVINGGELSDLDGTARDEDGVVNGRLTLRGYTDRWGRVQEPSVCDSQPLSLDCVPIEAVNLPFVQIQYRDDGHGLPDGIANYDTAPLGEFWVQFPN